MRILLGLVLVIGLSGGGWYYYQQYYAADPPPNFRTVSVKRGDLDATISATGIVQPEEVVDVGAQVAGKITKLPVDYGSTVKDGTVLANIDDSIYKAQVDLASAGLERAKADVKQSQAKLDQTREEWRRAEALLPQKAIAETDYILASANFKAADANVALCQAAIKQAEASLELARTNLNYTVIKSPVEGVIVDRRVNVGQTVVASLNAPSLFLLAKDLRRIQIWAQVNEADIGRIRPGLPVKFTVDAYPKEDFHGTVGQVRLNAKMDQNVVTYTVVVVTENKDLRLLPYLTANLQFEVEKHSDVLKVPNTALRWRPRPTLVAPDAREATAKAGGRGRERGKPGGPPAGERSAGPRSSDRGRIWLADGNFVRPLEVQIGVSDGTSTEVAGPQLKEGMEIVIGEVRAEQAADTNNPFAPKLFRGSQSKGS